ncbi:MAG: MFS transporter [Elsteraceae bacterium]
MSVGYWAVLVFAPAYLQQNQGLSTDQAGAAMLAATLPMAILPTVGAALAGRWGWRRTLTLGMALVSLGIAIVAWTAVVGGALTTALIGFGLAGCGGAFINSQLSGALVAFAPPERAGTASAVATTLRQGGFAIGVALLGAAAGVGSHPYAASFLIAATAAALGALAAWTLIRTGS